jgi:hypothetical protein
MQIIIGKRVDTRRFIACASAVENRDRVYGSRADFRLATEAVTAIGASTRDSASGVPRIV